MKHYKLYYHTLYNGVYLNYYIILMLIEYHDYRYRETSTMLHVRTCTYTTLYTINTVVLHNVSHHRHKYNTITQCQTHNYTRTSTYKYVTYTN